MESDRVSIHLALKLWKEDEDRAAQILATLWERVSSQGRERITEKDLKALTKNEQDKRLAEKAGTKALVALDALRQDKAWGMINSKLRKRIERLLESAATTASGAEDV